ncbi:MAG: polyprenyl diphosphate synthase [Oscillospiraceae bacterium]
MPENSQLPKHIGIIMDGNGRWAKKRGLPRKFGHRTGASTFKTIAKYANQIGLAYMTMYVFSTENWKRPQDEIDSIIKILRNYLDEMDAYVDENIRVRFIGDLTIFDDDIQEKMARAVAKSSDSTGLTLNLAVNYGGRSEITEAVRQIATLVADGTISPADISEDLITKSLYTGDDPPVDLIIRPSGEYRLSNFLIWQSAYAEFIFMDDILWPDFKPAHLDEALAEYSKRNRRFGGI